MVWNTLIAGAILILHLILYPIADDPFSLTLFGNLAQGLALLMAAIQFTRITGRSPHSRAHTYFLIALGFWIWVSAHAFLSYSELLLYQPATGTVTDAIWLVGYVLILRSLYLLNRQTLSDWRVVFGFLPVMLLVLTVLVLLTPLRRPDHAIVVKIEQVLFPFLDLWIASLAFRLAQKTETRAWTIGGFGSLIIGIADLIFPFFETMAHPVYRYLDIPLFAGYSLWWLLGAALAERTSR